jgi:hypothetical protein
MFSTMTNQETWAGKFFGSKELNDELGLSGHDKQEDGANALWAWVHDLAQWQPPTRWLPIDGSYFRGQSDQGYGLTNSLYRSVRATLGTRVAEADMARAEQRSLDTARGEGIGRKMTDGELLMVLQHHLMPTRLIDVSTSVKEALYFAVESNDGADGRLFILHPHEPEDYPLGASEPFAIDSTSSTSPEQQLLDWQAVGWRDAAIGDTRASGEWSKRISVVRDPALDPRMRAQVGHFLLGGMVTRYGGRSMSVDAGEDVPLEEWANVTTLSIHFPARRKNTTPHRSWNASGWSVRIEAGWKPYLRTLLANELEPITRDSMYPPIEETKRLLMRSVAGRV